MVLVPCKIEETKRGWTDLQGLLKDFMNGDTVCVKVENYSHKNARCCRECLYAATKRRYKGMIKVIKRGDDIYLAKTIAIQK